MTSCVFPSSNFTELRDPVSRAARAPWESAGLTAGDHECSDGSGFPGTTETSSSLRTRPAVIARMLEESDSCAASGWDGYNGQPVRHATFIAALKFVAALPLEFPDPSVCADASGALTFEWYVSRDLVISVGIEPDGRLTYAALAAGGCPMGESGFLGEIPDDVLYHIRRVVKEVANGTSATERFRR